MTSYGPAPGGVPVLALRIVCATHTSHRVRPRGTDARRLTRVRRFRYYPLRIVEGMIEVAIPG